MTRVKSSTFTVTFGGWYQRTTLHLSEIYDLFLLGHSNLPLSQEKLSQLKTNLALIEVSREVGYLEYIQATTQEGIVIRYYEDGLYILEIESADIPSARRQLQHYFDNCLNPAISYIFSLGAPTPKILADIKPTHPTVVLDHSHLLTPKVSSSLFGEVYSHLESQKIKVAKTPQYILISSPDLPHARDLVEMQIFFREFKDQLERYLNIHREVWEEISQIKERRYLRGGEVEAVRATLDSHQKTINLISSRIAQMGSYVNTRSSIARQLQLEEHLLTIFRYKFETLQNTHSYIREIWSMTSNYLATAIQVINEVQSQSTASGIQSLRLITTVGVLSGIIGYLSKDSFPTVTLIGIWYYFVLLLLTWIINSVIGLIYRNLRYELKFSPLTSRVQK
jgi:hypothetical protein